MVSFSHSFAVKLFQNSNNIQMEKRPWMGHFYIRCIRSKLLYNLKSNFESKRVFCKYLKLLALIIKTLEKGVHFSKGLQKKHFTWKVTFYKIAQKVSWYLGYFWRKFVAKNWLIWSPRFLQKLFLTLTANSVTRLGFFIVFATNFLF